MDKVLGVKWSQVYVHPGESKWYTNKQVWKIFSRDIRLETRPSKPDTFIRCWDNAGSASTTLTQHQLNMGPIRHVYWVCINNLLYSNYHIESPWGNLLKVIFLGKYLTVNVSLAVTNMVWFTLRKIILSWGNVETFPYVHLIWAVSYCSIFMIFQHDIRIFHCLLSWSNNMLQYRHNHSIIGQ